MKRTTKINYCTDNGRELLEMEGCKAIVKPYKLNADELQELALACELAADELRAQADANRLDGVPTA